MVFILILVYKFGKESRVIVVGGNRSVDFWLFFGEKSKVEVLFFNGGG